MFSTDAAITVRQFSIDTISQGKAHFFLRRVGEPSAIGNLEVLFEQFDATCQML